MKPSAAEKKHGVLNTRNHRGKEEDCSMVGKEKRLPEHPRAKCIHHGEIFIVVAWDAFFAVGPLLGQGSTEDEAWESAGRPTMASVMPTVNAAVLSGERYFRKHRGKR